MKTAASLRDDDAKVLIADTLRLFVGLGKRVSWADLAAATAIKERTLRSYCEDSGPLMPLDVFMRVFAVLPPEAFGRVALRMGFSVAPAEVSEEGQSLRRVLAKASRLVANGNEFLEDGNLSPRERAIMADDALELLPAIQSLADTGTPH